MKIPATLINVLHKVSRKGTDYSVITFSSKEFGVFECIVFEELRQRFASVPEYTPLILEFVLITRDRRLSFDLHSFNESTK